MRCACDPQEPGRAIRCSGDDAYQERRHARKPRHPDDLNRLCPPCWDRHLQNAIPEDGDSGRISVLSPLGAALIGMAAGQSVRWHSATGEERWLRVLDIDSQPERRIRL
ncbi:GreA/GreB family elongation factor [Microvirga massiliensis]|uniref:GreA/GreB family elongation factor n=1 Tax=Microvirga massiliensis TaxID=1033741 RepID=UPI00062B45A7|nr:GreA/GreB family elongation factor [Microvirga massiliensis]